MKKYLIYKNINSNLKKNIYQILKNRLDFASLLMIKFFMKKVLLISYNSCYPLNHGGAIAQYYFIDGLKAQFQFVLCTEINSETELKQLEVLKQKQPTLKIYSLNSFQRVSKTHTGKKFRHYIKSILSNFQLKKNPNLNILPNSDDFADSYFEHVDNKHTERFVKFLNEIIIKEDIEQVQLEFYNTIDLCFAIPKNIRKIFIHHELRFKRMQLAFERSPLSYNYKHYLIDKTEIFERSCLKVMDDVVVFNENDAVLLRKDCKSIKVSPFGIPDELVFKKNVSSTFDKFIFIGGEGHTPNLLGLTWFLDEIYVPNMNQIDYPIWIIGDWSDNLKNKYKIHPEIVFCGVVDSIEPYFEKSIFINSILTGAGLRTKVLHAFVNSVPVLSTRFGAEGCYFEEVKDHIGFFDSSEEFIELITNNKFVQLGEAGFNYYNKYFDKENLLKIRKKILLN